MNELTLAELCELVVDCKNRTPPEAAPGERTVGFAIGTPHIINGRIRLSEAKPVSQETYDIWTARAIPRAGDIILTREAPVGRVGRIEEGMQICLGQRTMLLRPDRQRSDSRFLHYFLLSPAIQDLLHAQASGSTVAHLRVAQVRDLKVPPVPDVDEQRRIGAVLGALDDKIAVNERIGATALELADLHFSLVHKSARISTTLGQVVKSRGLSLGDGYRTKRAEHGRHGIPILRVAEVGDNEIHPTRADRVREEFRSAMGSKVSRPGDIVLTTKGTVGRVAMIPASSLEFVYSPQLCYFRIGSNSALSRNFLFHWFRSREFWRQAEVLKGQTDMADYLSLNDIRSLKISMPDEISVTEFEGNVGLLRSRMEAAASESAALVTLRDTLLPQLMSGRLRVKDVEKIVGDHT